MFVPLVNADLVDVLRPDACGLPLFFVYPLFVRLRHSLCVEDAVFFVFILAQMADLFVACGLVFWARRDRFRTCICVTFF